MSITKWPQKAEKFEIQAYKHPKNLADLKKSHVPFSGFPQKHPYDKKKVILVPDPYSTSTFFLEFNADDIAYAEELPSLVNFEGETVTMARIWVKKQRIAVRCSPFVVEDTRKIGI